MTATEITVLLNREPLLSRKVRQTNCHDMARLALSGNIYDRDSHLQTASFQIQKMDSWAADRRESLLVLPKTSSEYSMLHMNISYQCLVEI